MKKSCKLHIPYSINRSRVLTSTLFLVCLIVCLLPLRSALAAQNYTAIISQLQPPNANEDCVFFTLTGIPQADPINPNSPWFSFPRGQTGFAEIYAALLGAKLAGSTVNVVTTGTVAGGACGNYAGILFITVQ